MSDARGGHVAPSRAEVKAIVGATLARLGFEGEWRLRVEGPAAYLTMLSGGYGLVQAIPRGLLEGDGWASRLADHVADGLAEHRRRVAPDPGPRPTFLAVDAFAILAAAPPVLGPRGGGPTPIAPAAPEADPPGETWRDRRGLL